LAIQQTRRKLYYPKIGTRKDEPMQTDVAASPAPGFAKHPGYKIALTPVERRMRVWLGCAAIADSSDVLAMREGDYAPVYYFPRADVNMDLLAATDHGTHCPFKGDASYWTIEAGDRREKSVAWSYESPYDEMARIKDYIAFYDNRVKLEMAD
jgi:uncharacterized protein (DUF427 family)